MHFRLPRPQGLRAVFLAASMGVAALGLAAPAAGIAAEHAAAHEAPKPAHEAPQSASHETSQSAPDAGPLAQFHGTKASPGVREVANWAFYTHDNQGRSVVILDKQNATVYAFDPEGKLIASAPALLGLTVGDDTPAGVGDKPLSEIPEDQRTTPAGRFVAQLGHDDTGVDVVWIDYEAAVAMHRVITTYPAQRRPERLASPNARDRRISWGCINLPIPFYEHVLSPTVRKTGAIVYVLPETRAPSEVFGSWDVTDPAARPSTEVKRPAPVEHAAPLPPHHLREPQALRTSDSAADF